MNRILIALGVVGIFFLGVIIFGIGVSGDRYCKIQIQNGGTSQMILKTFRYTNYDKKLTVDSIALVQNEKFEIGHCINCSIIDTLDIDFDAISILGSNGDFKMMNKVELIEYLETMDKEDCITYVVH